MNKIIINGDQAHLYSHPKPVPRGQSQFSRIQFEFSAEWDNFTKIAQFQDSSNRCYNVEVSGDVCFCPSELELGSVFVRVKGYPKNSESPVIATANEICLIVVQGFQSGGQPPIPPTPDLYQKLLEQFKSESGGSALTDDDILDSLIATDMLSAVKDADGKILTDETNKILLM